MVETRSGGVLRAAACMVVGALALVGVAVPAAGAASPGRLDATEIALTGPGAAPLAPAADRGRAKEARRSPRTVDRGWSADVEVADGTQLLDVTWSGAPAGAVRVRVPLPGGGWSPWATYANDADEGPDQGGNGRNGVGPLFVGQDGVGRVQVEVAGGSLRDVRLDAMRWHPPTGTPTATGRAGATSVASGLPIHPRSEWAPGGWQSNRPGCTKAPVVMKQLAFVVVHHTAESNSYRAADVPGILAATYRFHTNSRGWCDIAYNFLIDRFGQVWQGRSGAIDAPIMGGHAKGFNTDSVGIALMGQHERGASPAVAAPSAAALTSLRRLITWKLAIHGLDAAGPVRIVSNGSTRFPMGKVVSLPRIQGHIDSSKTDCPGGLVRTHFAALRAGVAADLPATVRPDLWKPFANGPAFVAQQWVDAYGRPPTNGEAAPRISQVLRDGASLATVVDAIVVAPRADDRIAATARLAQAMLSAPADGAMLTDLVARRDKGVALDAIAELLATQPRFLATYGQGTSESFARSVYQNLLRRQAKPAEVADVVRRLAAKVTRARVVLDVTRSEEHKRLLQHPSQLTAIWFSLLRRPPTVAEQQRWIPRLDAGTPTGTVVAAVLATAEYRNRFR